MNRRPGRGLAGPVLACALAAGALAHDPPTGRGPVDARAMFLRSPILPGVERERGRFIDRTEPLVLPFLLEGARRSAELPAHVLVYDWADAGEGWRVDRVRLQHRGRTLAELEPDLECSGDPGFGRLQADLERLPTPLSRIRRRQRWFAVPSALPLAGERAAALLEAAPARARELLGAEGPPAWAEFALALDLAAVLPDGPPGAGERGPLLRFEVDLTRLANGQRVTVRTDRILGLQPAWPTPNAAFAERFGPLLRGDLHVHSALSEGPGVDLAAARGGVDLGGAFTPAELDPQLDALGLDFAVLCDGPDATLPAEPALAWHRAAEARADRPVGRGRLARAFEGRLAVAQSPTLPDPRGGWTLEGALAAHAAGELDAVEIWSGDWQGGQGDDVGFWVELLLTGARLAAVSGSDTRDEPIAFGATHVLGLETASDPASLAGALAAGCGFLSNDDLLAFVVHAGDAIHGPGQTAPAGEPRRLELHASTAGPTRIELFEGVVGAEAERVLHVFEAVEGESVLELKLPPAPPDSYLRAYAEGADGRRTAYTNALWFDAP